MARVYVFAIDWVPQLGDVASGGGLRSLQIIESLQDAGHDVGFAVPHDSRAVQSLRLTAPRRLKDVDLYREEDQIDLLRRVNPDAVLWLWPSVRRIPFTGLGNVAHICDLNGLQDYELANGSPSLLGHVRGLVTASCIGADAVFTGSPEQHGYWLAQLGDAPNSPHAELAGYAVPPSVQGPVVTACAKLRRLHFIGNVYSWSASTTLLTRAADWASAQADVRLHMIGGTDPGGATPLDDLRALRDLERHPSVDSQQEATFDDAMAAFGPGSIALDLNRPTVERQLAVPIRTVNALMHGVPIVTTIDSPLTRRMERAGAGVIATNLERDGLERTLSELLAMPAKEFGAMSVAARAFAELEFNYESSRDTICRVVDRALERRTTRAKAWLSAKPEESPIGHVLVITDQTANLRDLRVDLPFGVLTRRRLISGYSVWNKGRVVFSTRNDTRDLAFDAIWVQRSVAADVALLLDAMQLPFVYDLDDNLLVSPAYREAFSGENLQAARNFVRSATVVSCSTARLASIVQRYAATQLVSKVVVTQNILRNAPVSRPVGEPTCVIWASSDVPALTEDRLAVLKAIRDFCLTHDLRLVCVGAEPPLLMLESDVEVEHVGMMPYPNYLDMLRSLTPAIMVCPLETRSDAATQDFVDGKSDVKILEALAAGVVGVFSAARPYLDTDLPKPIVCENTYRSWFEGLSRARRVCMEPGALPKLPSWRLASEAGVLPFFDALSQTRLPRSVPVKEFTDRLELIQGRLTLRPVALDRFNETFYLARYPDVKIAIESQGIRSAYEHYIKYGHSERRMAFEGDICAANGQQWWANLMGTVNDLSVSVANRQPQIDDLKTRRTMRLRLRKTDRR